MKHQALLLGAAAFVGCCAWTGIASAAEDRPDVSIEFRYYAPKVSGSVKGDDFYSQRIQENKLEYDGDLGIDDAKAPEVRVKYGNIKVDYIGLRSSSDDGFIPPAPIRHKDRYYLSGKPLDTDLDFDYLSVDWQGELSTAEQHETYWTAGLRYVHESATSTGWSRYSPTGADEYESESESATGIVPAVGVGGRWALGSKFDVNAAVSGMPLGSHGHIADVDVGLSYYFTEKWSLTGGWRYLDLKLKKDDKTAVYKASGPFIGVSYAF